MFKKITVLLAMIAVAFSLHGCAGMADAMSKAAGIGVVKEEKSTFDGATIVTMSPAFLYSGKGMSSNSINLGARWSSKFPDHVVFQPTHSSSISSDGRAYVNISKLEVNIDGEISSYDSAGLTKHDSSSYNTVSKTIYTESKGAVVLPFSVLQKMMAATDCRVRIYSSSGYEDSVFHVERIPGGQSAAKFSLKEFIARIESAKSAP